MSSRILVGLTSSPPQQDTSKLASLHLPLIPWVTNSPWKNRSSLSVSIALSPDFCSYIENHSLIMIPILNSE